VTGVHHQRRSTHHNLAEKAAKEALGTTLVDAAGDLGAAHAEQQAAANVVQTAKDRADEIRRAAETEAATVIADAEQHVTTANTTYAAAWNAAKSAGWTPAQLRSMGYTKPPTHPTPRTSTRATSQRANEPTSQRANEPTSQRANEPTSQRASNAPEPG